MAAASAATPRPASGNTGTTGRFWPPRAGDVWIGDLDKPWPSTFVCPWDGWLVGANGLLVDEIAWKFYGPFRLIWRDGSSVTTNHADDLGRYTVDIKVTGPDGTSITPGVREIRTRITPLEPTVEVQRDLRDGIAYVPAGSTVTFLTDQQVDEITHQANECGAATWER